MSDRSLMHNVSPNSRMAEIGCERLGGLLTITINRPQVMNALTNEMHVELGRVLDDFECNPELRVAIITGAGDRAFCTGNDFKAANTGTALTPDDWSGGFGGLVKRFGMSKPVIAAVNGWAMGGGFEIVLACDIVIAAANARFGLPEVRRGRIAAAGGVHRLPRKLPVTLAMGMMLTGHDIDAVTAERWGLVNEVAAEGRLMSTAEGWANEILQCAPLAVDLTKQAALAGLDLPLGQAIEVRPPAYAAWRRSEESAEGARAFVEKRKPGWSQDTSPVGA